jgi:hypothetical protein
MDGRVFEELTFGTVDASGGLAVGASQVLENPVGSAVSTVVRENVVLERTDGVEGWEAVFHYLEGTEVARWSLDPTECVSALIRYFVGF